jgi:hypothetical protein
MKLVTLLGKRSQLEKRSKQTDFYMILLSETFPIRLGRKNQIASPEVDSISNQNVLFPKLKLRIYILDLFFKYYVKIHKLVKYLQPF